MLDASELHGEFVLSSGATSSVYFDKFRFLTVPELLRDVAEATAALLAPGTELLGAPEGAAMLLVAAVSLRTGLPVTVVRKQPKAYGTRAQVEGVVPPGAVTTLLEDVSTTGQQVRAAAEVLTRRGRRRPADRARDRPGRCGSAAERGLRGGGGGGAAARRVRIRAQTRSHCQIRSCQSHRLPR